MKLKPFGFLSGLLNRAAGIGRVPIRWLVLLLTAIIGAGLYLYVPGAESFITRAIGSAYDPHRLKQLIVSYRSAAPLMILVLTLLQAIITILPLCFVMMASTMAMGFFPGVAVSIVCQVVAGYVTMRLTRYFGHSLAERFEASGKLSSMRGFIRIYGKWGVLVARLVPFGSFDVVNFASGLLNVKDQDFILGTVFGVIAATCFYGLIGANLYDPSEVSSAVYYVSCSVIALAIVFALWLRRKPASLNKSRQPG